MEWTIVRVYIVAEMTRRCNSTVGFIGLGNMGKHMARNLVKKGFNIVAYDSNSSAAESVSSGGEGVNVNIASSIAELSSKVDSVVTMLPDNDSVMQVYSSDDGIIKNAKKGATLIDSSTVDPKVPQAVGTLAEKQGLVFFDAPVSGGVMAAENAQLTFMVGGIENEVCRLEAILEAMGKKMFYCGKYGSGQAAKICNNMILGISMGAVSEGLNLGVGFGLDPKLLSAVINSSSGRCWASEVYNPVPGILETSPSSKDYQGGFASKLITKDLSLAVELAKRTSSSVPLGNKVFELYKEICKGQYADRDFSIMYKFLNESKGKV
ncbi:3-hydroxyisobutyrate dehydrogenase, mitochondrial [Nilaparvata lugens]|uniref:3-hydroxyisobutyrate dehydrogenase, mitochondrial n=1 Tax=Nilaparvata lugens TaxID=108931 RepID=UPI00193CAD7A|nr:3-hydroxyisobutyrate dehydrogenase, mitochondrial [Nilaparvata lugens]